MSKLIYGSQGELQSGEFLYPFEFKTGPTETITEGELGGVPGIFIEGYMAVFAPRDRTYDNWNLDLRAGSVTRKAFEDYFKLNPIVLFEHGKNTSLGRIALGKTVDHRIDETGVWVRDFLPRPEKSAGLVYDVYQKIKSGVYRTFSIAGRWAKNSKQTIVEVADVLEHSVVSVPMMGLATFSLAKAIELKSQRGFDIEGALMLMGEYAEDEKRGAMISAANKKRIEQAIAVLEELIGEQDDDDPGGGGPDPGMDMPGGGGMPNMGMGDGGKAKATPLPPNADTITARQRLQVATEDFGDPANKKFPILSQNDVNSAASLIGKAADPEAVKRRIMAICKRKNFKPPLAWTQAAQPAAKSLSGPGPGAAIKPALTSKPPITITSKGAYKMKDENGNEITQDGEGEDANVVTLSADQFKTFQAMQEQFDRTQKEAEATRIAEKKLQEEQDADKKRREVEEKRQTEIQTMAEEIAKNMRGGSRMSFGGDTSGAGNTSQNHMLSAQQKRINYNRRDTTREFSFLQFAKAGMQNREYQYYEDLKSFDPDFKALQENVGSSGGYIVPIQQSTEIEDLLRAQAVVRQMPGVRTIPMSSDTLTMPRLTADATAAWASEMATLTASQQSFGQIRFVAHKLYALVQVSKEMMADANPGVDQIIRESIAAALALKEDDAFLQGTGIGEVPLGIIKTPNVTSYAYVTGAASAAPEFKSLAKATGIIRSVNAKPNGVVMNSRIGDQVLSVIDTTGQPIALNAIGGYRWNEMQASQGRASNDPNAVQFGTLLGMTQAFANQLAISATSGGTGSVVVGDWRRFVIGNRQDIEVEIDRSAGFLSDSVYIKATKRVDCAITIPEAFVVITAFPGIDIV